MRIVAYINYCWYLYTKKSVQFDTHMHLLYQICKMMADIKADVYWLISVCINLNLQEILVNQSKSLILCPVIIVDDVLKINLWMATLALNVFACIRV